MSDFSTNTGTKLNWTAYKSGHNPFTISLIESGSAYDITALTLTLAIFSKGSRVSKLVLTEGSGLTNGGAAGTIAIAITLAQASIKLANAEYDYELTYLLGGLKYRMFYGVLTLTNEGSPSGYSTSTTVTIGDGTSVSAAVTLADHDDSIPLSAFASELTFSSDQELATVSGGTRTFTLAASGHKNGVGIIARINEPVAINFPASFVKSLKSDDVSTTSMNMIYMLYKEDYDGAGNDKVLYSIVNETAI